MKFSIFAALALTASASGVQAATYTLSFMPDDALPYHEWITLDYDGGTTFRISDSFTRDTVPNPPVINSLHQTSDTALRYALELELSPEWTSIYTSQFAESGGIYFTYWGQTDAPLTNGLSFAGAVHHWNAFTGEECDGTGQWIVRDEADQVSAVPLPAPGLVLPFALGTLVVVRSRRNRRPGQDPETLVR